MNDGVTTEAASRGDGEAYTVAYVDPDPADTATATAALTADGRAVEVLTARSVAAATDLLAGHSLDCLVTEYTLPDGTGLDLLRTVRERDPELPVVLFTADGSEAVASEAVAAGVTEYVPKAPLDDQAAELADRVYSAITTDSAWEAVIGRMTDAFMALDEEWRFTYLNESTRHIIGEAASTGDPERGLVGQRIWDVVPDAVDTAFYSTYERAMETQEPETLEAYYEPLETWFSVRVFPSESGLSVYFRDVTARRERENSLAEREAYLTEMYRVISRKETPFEEKVEHLLEVGREALGTEFAALSHVDGDDYTFEVVLDPTGQTEAGDVIPLGSTNCERAIVERETLVLADIAAEAPALAGRPGFTEMGVASYVGMPVVVDDDVYGTFCFYGSEPRAEAFANWEVTLVELMGNWVSYELERERRERELTRERNRLDDFASLVSHDLRNPLNVASGNLELVADEYDGDPTHVEGIERAVARMDALIDDMLTLARSGDQVVEPTDLDLGDLADRAWSVVESGAATLTVEDRTATVTGDDGRLQRLFENLFRNAVEHAGSDVNVRVGPLADGGGFYVEDDGPGIPPDEREAVFESGYSTSDDGTGFGLGIVREIAQAHGGTVTVAEGADGGARFELRGLTVE